MYYDVIIIGGGPGGVMGAISAKQHYPEKSVLIIRKESSPQISCGIPHTFYNFQNAGKLDEQELKGHNVELIQNNVVDINKEDKLIALENGEFYQYDKLVISTGAVPIIPKISGVEKLGIYTVKKEQDYLQALKKDIDNSTEIVIMGGGFIGVEFADYLAKIPGKNVILIEKQDRILRNSFDKSFSQIVHAELEKTGVKIITNISVKSFEGENRIESILLSNNKRINAQLVIIGIGSNPCTELAKKAKLEIAPNNTISVDEYMHTSDKNIFAVGDCAEKKDFFTRKTKNVMLASTATSEGRTAGANLYEIQLVKNHQGTISAYSTVLDNIIIASVGHTEESALIEGFEIVTGEIEIPQTQIKNVLEKQNSNLRVKLVFTAQTGVILGGQVTGGVSTSEIINVISVAIQKTMTISELETLQVATHPSLTPAPTMYPIIKAAEIAHLNHQIKGHHIVPSS